MFFYVVSVVFAAAVVFVAVCDITVVVGAFAFVII